MANQRKAGIERVTLTIPDHLLRAAEAEAKRQGIDRLALMREALNAYLRPQAGSVVREDPPPTAKAARRALAKKR